jgi:hypothetical protein
LFAFAQVIILQADLLRLTEKDPHLKTPPFKQKPDKRAKPSEIETFLQQKQQAASVSPTKPTSPTKLTVTATLRSVVGKVAKQTFDAAALNLARRIPEKHVCNHCTKCTEGSCMTCKCDKCKASQPNGKRPSALRK